MARYDLYLVEGPSADKRTLERAAWMLPQSLKRAALLNAPPGAHLDEWILIASTDSRRDIKKIQRALRAIGCVLALDEQKGGSAWNGAKEVLTELLSRDAARRRRAARREVPLWDRGEGLSDWVGRLWGRRRALLAAGALLLVAGSAALLWIVLFDRPGPARGPADRDAAIDELAKLGSSMEPAQPLPGVPGDIGSGAPTPVATAGVPGRGRGREASLPSSGAGELPGIRAGDGEAKKDGDQKKGLIEKFSRWLGAVGEHAIPIAGFLTGLGSAGPVFLGLRELRVGTNRRKMWFFRVAPLAVVAVAAASLLVMSLGDGSSPGPPSPNVAPSPAKAIGTGRSHRDAAAGRTAGAGAGGRPPIDSFRGLVAALPPPIEPACSPGSPPYQELLCRIRERYGPDGSTDEEGGPSRGRMAPSALVDAALDAMAEKAAARGQPAQTPPESGHGAPGGDAPQATMPAVPGEVAKTAKAPSPPAEASRADRSPRAGGEGVPSARSAPSAMAAPRGAGGRGGGAETGVGPIDLSSGQTAALTPASTERPSDDGLSARPSARGGELLRAAVPAYLAGLTGGSLVFAALPFVAKGEGKRRGRRGETKR